MPILNNFFFFFSSRRRHTRYWRDWSSDVCSSDLAVGCPPRRTRPARWPASSTTTTARRGRRPWCSPWCTTPSSRRPPPGGDVSTPEGQTGAAPATSTAPPGALQVRAEGRWLVLGPDRPFVIGRGEGTDQIGRAHV